MILDAEDLDNLDETTPFARFRGASEPDQHLNSKHEELLAAALAFGRIARRDAPGVAELEEATLRLEYAAVEYHGATSVATAVPCLLSRKNPRLA
jgi:hypothetical protein